MIGVLVCGSCGARWTWGWEAPERPGNLRCTDCGGPLAFDDPAHYGPRGRCFMRIPFPLGLSRRGRLKQLKEILASPHHTRWLKLIALQDVTRLLRQPVGGGTR
jgi:hypothetical protein